MKKMNEKNNITLKTVSSRLDDGLISDIDLLCNNHLITQSQCIRILLKIAISNTPFIGDEIDLYKAIEHEIEGVND